MSVLYVNNGGIQENNNSEKSDCLSQKYTWFIIAKLYIFQETVAVVMEDQEM